MTSTADLDSATGAPVRQLIARVQLTQLKVRLGLVETLDEIALDPERRFLLLDLLGAGGTGVVFLGHDTKLDRRVALKVLHWWSASAEELEARVMREAKILATLQDRNILVVYDVDRAEGGELFIAAQHVAGFTLREWQRDRRPAEILRVYLEAGRGLAAAHEQGVIHRDFKPDNVLLDEADPPHVYVADFGLADGRDAGDSPAAQASSSRRLGTPAYMAPEQRQSHGATVLSDQYAFCVSVWEAYARERPPARPLRASRPPNMPRWLHRLLLVGMSPRPADRFASLTDLLERIERGTRRRRRSIGLGVGVALLAASSAVGYGYGSRPRDCSELAAADELWSMTQSLSLRAHLSSFPQQYAPRLAASMIEALQANVEAQRTLARELCEQREHAIDEHLLAAKRDCLGRWRARTRTQLRALESLSVDAYPAAWSLFQPLAEFAELCERGPPPPAIEVELQAVLDEAQNATLLLEHERALDLARRALELASARAQSCSPGNIASRDLGRALQRLGEAYAAADQPELARDALLEAMEHAQGCGDEGLQVELGLELAQIYALQLGRSSAARLAIAEVRGQLERLDEPDVSIWRADLLKAHAFVALSDNRPEEAIQGYGDALAALGDPWAHPLAAAKLHSDIGAAQYQAGQLEEARTSYEQARVLVAQTLGLSHPEAQTHLHWVQLNEGLLARRTDNSDLARETFEDLFDAPEHVVRTKAMNAWLSLEFDGRDAAPAEVSVARDLLDNLRADPMLPPRVRAEGLTLAGQVLISAGDESGFELVHAGVDLWVEHFPGDPTTAVAATSLAQALRLHGRDEEARATARMVRSLTQPLPPPVEAALANLEAKLGM